MTTSITDDNRSIVMELLRRARLWVLTALLVSNGYSGDVTETPFSIQKGDWFIETDTIRWSRDRVSGKETTIVVYGETLIGYGLTEAIELQASFAPFVEEKVTGNSGTSQSNGGGDVTIRANIELVRRDDDLFGLSLLPFVRLPTGFGELQVDRIESGLAVPVAWSIAERWDISATGVLERFNASDGTGGAWVVSTSVSIDFGITESVGAYVEVSNVAEDSDLKSWGATAHFGAIVTINDHLDLTFGFNLGMTDPAFDQETFLRLSSLW